MPRPGVTYFDVAQAATKLLEQDIRPSIEEVRKVLGTGSNSTINRHLREWRDKQGKQLEAEKGLPESLLTAVKGIYEAIQEDAENKITEIRTETEQAIGDLKSKLFEMTQSNQQITQEKKDCEKKLKQSQADNLKLQQQLNEQKQQLDKSNADNHSLQMRLEDRNIEINRLAQQLKHSQNNLEHFRESVRQQRETETARYESRINKLENEALQYQHSLSKLKEKISELQGQNRLLENDKSTNISKLEQSQQQCNEYMNTVAVKKAELTVLNQKTTTLQKENDQLLKSERSNHETIHSLQLKLEKANGKLETLNAALSKADEYEKKIRQEQLILVQENAKLAAKIQNVNSL